MFFNLLFVLGSLFIFETRSLKIIENHNIPLTIKQRKNCRYLVSNLVSLLVRQLLTLYSTTRSTSDSD